MAGHLRADPVSATALIVTGPAELTGWHGIGLAATGTIVLRDSLDASGPIKQTLYFTNTSPTELSLADAKVIRFEIGVHATVTTSIAELHFG